MVFFFFSFPLLLSVSRIPAPLLVLDVFSPGGRNERKEKKKERRTGKKKKREIEEERKRRRQKEKKRNREKEGKKRGEGRGRKEDKEKRKEGKKPPEDRCGTDAEQDARPCPQCAARRVMRTSPAAPIPIAPRPRSAGGALAFSGPPSGRWGPLSGWDNAVSPFPSPEVVRGAGCPDGSRLSPRADA